MKWLSKNQESNDTTVVTNPLDDDIPDISHPAVRAFAISLRGVLWDMIVASGMTIGWNGAFEKHCAGKRYIRFDGIPQRYIVNRNTIADYAREKKIFGAMMRIIPQKTTMETVLDPQE